MDEEREPPKKIALKVPSLFIKSAPVLSQSGSTETENGEKKSNSRPMPASMKKKLDESKKVETDSLSSVSDVSLSSSNNGENKPKRPMPASMKKKLEESKKIATDSLSSISDVSQSSISTNNGDEKPKRPMPASAKRKLEEKVDSSNRISNQEEAKPLNKPMPSSVKIKLTEGEQNTEPEKSEESDSGTEELKEKSEKDVKVRPMPASARKRMEETIKTESLNTANSKSTERRSESRPMPASAKKLLGVQTEDEDNTNDETAKEETTSVEKTLISGSEPKRNVKKPMPASARKKIQEESNITGAEDEKFKEDDKTKEDHEAKLRDESDNLNDQTQLMESQSDYNKIELNKVADLAESKKINISLGGIKFPTFKKPMPASAKKKAEVKEQGQNKPEEDEFESTMNISTSEVENQNTIYDQPLRTTRRGRSSKEFMMLEEKTFPCEVCGQEFYQLCQKNKHEKTHLSKNEDKTEEKAITQKKSVKSNSDYIKRKKPTKETKYKGMKNCPYCNRGISNWKKISGHVSRCGKRPANFSCTECDKKFIRSCDLEVHMRQHESANKSQDVIEAVPVPLSNLDFADDSVPSPMSSDSKNSSKTSVVEKPRPMPKSVKAKLQKDNEVYDKDIPESETPKQLSTGVQSFKRKIADVLSSLGSRRFDNTQSSEVSNEIEEEREDDSPPRKKTNMSKEGDCESIRGHPMPASVKKKLQERGSKDLDRLDSEPSKKKSAPSTSKLQKLDQDLDDCECEVCHKIFTSCCNRQRHEKSVHKIKYPRVRKIKSSYVSPPPSPKPEKIIAETEMIGEPVAPTLDLSIIKTGSGTCPICSKYMTNLKRHIRRVHKIDETDSSNSLVKQPVVRPSAPKSYKIYKTTTNKLKQKFASSTLTKKPVISLEKVMPLAKFTEDAITETKAENKVIGSTASSDLRCACCDKIFEVKCDFYDHMSMEHPKLQRLITCKLCTHRFSHEEDFFLHIQFKHPSLVADMKQKTPKSSTKKSVSSPAKDEPVKQRSSSRRTDKSVSAKSTAITKTISITISSHDKQRADAVLKKQASRKSQKIDVSTTPGRTTRKSVARALTPEPKDMEESFIDDEPDDHFDDSAMQVDEEEEESGIAITATFSQKSASPQKSSNATGSFDLDPMHCSTCNEVFYSYEALRKHELYFHNVKTTKMCPICGVYPTRLSRHLLAHENKTVHCACNPCNLNFPDFKQLLKHNLEKHPGANGGASCKPGGQNQTGISKHQQNESIEAYRCSLCKKEFSGSSSARRHIRRVHSEHGDNAENFVEKFASDKTTSGEKDSEVEEILQETSKKLLDSDWGDDDDVLNEPEAPSLPQPSSTLKKPSRPMPASARAKLQQQQEEQSKTATTSSETKVQMAKPVGRAMPASVRAKLDAQTKTLTEPSKVSQPKPARPMPASVRAKLLSQNSTSENSRDSSVVSSSSTKPKRPMPASVKAKLGITSATGSDIRKSVEAAVTSDDDDQPPVLTPEVIIETKSNKIGQNADRSPGIVVTLGDDDDDPMDNDYLPEREESSEPIPPSVPTFSIADEIAEHNRAVRIAMGDNNPTNSEFSFNMFQCKLCSKKFDTADATRRHIHKAHSEYGPDHAENLIGQLFDSYANTPRRRKSNVRYNDDYVDDDDEEVIIPRGTSRRPKQKDTDWTSSKISNPSAVSYENPTSSDDNPLLYACRFCGQRKDSAANIRRHIAKAHPRLNNQRENGVVVVGSNQEYMEVPPPLPPPQSKAATKPANAKAGGPIYVCRICSRCMAVRDSLYAHILKSHPDVEKGNVANYIQELNGNGSGSSVPDNSMAEAENSDNNFYCSMCQYQTSDESDYVRHHKTHTGGVSPYQCQYCSATFNRQIQLSAHVTREHTGAEFLTNDEAEISMEEVVGSNQISVATTSKIHIDSPKPLTLNRRYSSESNGQSNIPIKKYTPGPASRKTAAAKKSAPPPVEKVVPMDTVDSPPASPASPTMEHAEETVGSPPQEQNETSTFSYQGDLSSLFPSLGGGSAPGGIDALDDIDGGMCLD